MILLEVFKEMLFYYLILKSYLEDRFFRVIEGGEYSSYFPIRASVPQGSVLAPLL